MKTIIVTVLIACLVCGCATSGSNQSQSGNATEKWSEVERDPNYPYSEIKVVYRTVFDAMTQGYFRDFPELDAEYTEAMRAFIGREEPIDEFVSLMVRDEVVDVFQKAKGNPSYWDSEEFKSAYKITINTAVAIARMVVGGSIDVYVAQYVDKDPIRIDLFEIAETEDQKQFVAWVFGEVTVEEFVQDEFTGDYEFEEGDRIYGFSGGDWENLTGRQGYLVVRGGKIHDTIITLMN